MNRISRELLHNPAVLLDDRAEVLEVARMRARSASGSVDSPSAVEPTRSQKRTVTTLRCARATSVAESGAPQALQKLAPSGFSCPQLGQGTIGGV
jgi:hypothetical protein